MKKNYIIPAVLLGAALTVACNKQENGLVIEQGEENFRAPFTLEASLGATKTATEDGTKYTWSEGDALNVFYAKTGESVYSKNVCFNYTAEGNVFEAEGDVDLAEGDAYDWYVLYPYSSFIKTPVNDEGFSSIGSLVQEQDGNNSKAHLSGNTFPLYGKATNVSSDEKLKVDLQQVLSVIKVHVKNTSGEEITVNSVAVTAPEDIVGTYYIDFSATDLTFTERASSYVSKVANLTVENGTPIQNGSEADFYMGIKPFTAEAQSKIVVKVNDYEKTLVLDSKTMFTSGKIKTINFEFDKVGQAEEKGSINNPFSVAEAIAKAKEVGAKETDYIYYVQGKISAITEKFGTQYGNATFDLSDECSQDTFKAYRVYYLKADQKWQEGNEQVNIGDEVVVCGKIINYNNNTPETSQYTGYLVRFIKHAPTVSDVKAEVSEDGKVTFTASYTNKDGVKIEKAGFKYEGAASGEKSVDVSEISKESGTFSVLIDDLKTGAYTVKAYLNDIESTPAVPFKITDPNVENIEVVLDFKNMKAQDASGVQDYTSTWSMTTPEGKWNIVNANNNNLGWTYIRIGKKQAEDSGSISTGFSVDAAITSVTTNVKKNVASANASVKLIVATDSSFSSVVDTYDAVTIPSTAGDIVFTIKSPQKNCYYKLEYNSNNSTGTNGAIEVYSVTLRNF